jgi:hypothetical protein
MTVCPKCGAKLEGWESADLPEFNASVLAGSDRSAIEPPSEAVRLEMRKIELEAEIENAGGAVMSASGDEAEEAGPPSLEALEALQSGLLDATGPAGETDLKDRAAVWTEEDKA